MNIEPREITKELKESYLDYAMSVAENPNRRGMLFAGTGHGFSYQEVFQTKPPMARQWLQEYGARKRDMDPDFWVKQADAWIRTLHDAIGITKFVITDVRYRNEVDYIHSMGGKVIRIHHGHGASHRRDWPHR